MRLEWIKGALQGTCGHESWEEAQWNHHGDVPAEDEGGFYLSPSCRAPDPQLECLIRSPVWISRAEAAGREVLPEGSSLALREPPPVPGSSRDLLLPAFPRLFPRAGPEGALSWVGGAQPCGTPPWPRAWTSPDSATIPVQ